MLLIPILLNWLFCREKQRATALSLPEVFCSRFNGCSFIKSVHYVISLDEPFGALDMQTRSLMQELLLKVWQQTQKTVVLVTHDIDEAIFMSDRVIVMKSRPGKVKEILDIDMPRPGIIALKQPRLF